jgi:plastocyanin
MVIVARGGAAVGSGSAFQLWSGEASRVWSRSAAALFFTILLVTRAVPATGQGTAEMRGSSEVTVELTPASAEAEVGQKITFKAVAKDGSGKVSEGPAVWFAAPSDIAGASESGEVTFFNPGRVQVFAITGGGVGIAVVNVKPAKVARIDIEPPPAPIVVGGAFQLEATPRTANGIPRQNVKLSWTSEAPSIATVDAAGLVTGVAAGEATLKADVEGGSGSVQVQVIANPVRSLAIEPRSTTAKTGDVIRFKVQAKGEGGAVVEKPFVTWAVSGEEATIKFDGAFVAERPGTYAVTAASGERTSVASVVVEPRKVDRRLDVVGRAPVKEFEAAEQWIIGKHAYLASIADRVWVYDISDPSKPVKTDSIMVDARIVNDVSTTADGKIGVLTREGASSRKNGIVFFDASDPAHPKIISEYTETVTGGVHSAFIDGHYVYLTDDATGSLRVIDFADVKKPKEVARWQTESPIYKNTDRDPNASSFSSGRYLHDVYVKDGLIYLAYWRDGLVILDVGNGIKGGSPEKPQFVSQLRFNHHELYGPEWLAGTHTVFRYKDYVIVGDEVFPPDWGLNPAYERGRVPTRGILHIVDVSNIEQPRKVAEYGVPEAGAHNVWVEDDLLYMGHYYGGARVLDVSGELRGDLYKQGREVARLWTGDPNGHVPNLPNTWGAQPHGGLIYFNDTNSGLWITKLAEPRDRGLTTSPGD